MKSELIRFTKDREKLIISITSMSINTNVITFKTIHSDSFRKETIKTRIFILQVDNKITNTTKTFKERKIRYVMFLLREITIEWTVIYTD